MATPRKRLPLEVRFWSKVDRRAADECWLWTGATYEFGYGQIKGPLVRERTGFSGMGAHRLSWEIHHGPIPSGLHVLHRCDNPRCCNPTHLFLGTAADNAADKSAKGRCRTPSQCGEANGRARLKAADIPVIREMAAAGAEHVEIARRFGVHRSTIGRVVRRDLDGWRRVPG